jgi:uncharacterized membrane protein YfcA
MDWLLTFLIIVVSALIQACTGFGFALLAIPLLMLLFPAHYAISLSGLLSLVSCLSTLPRIYKDVDAALLKRLFIGGLIGLPLGGLLYYAADVSWLKLIVGISIILTALTMMYRISFPFGSGKRAGFCSGFMTSSIGMPGPPVILLLMSKQVGKEAFRGTSIAYYCLVYPISLAIQYASGHFEIDVIHDLLLIPAIFIGQAVGMALHQRISQSWFRRVTILLLFATAANSIIHSF